MADLGGIDTSMYGRLEPVKIPNLLGMAQTFANTQGQMQENEMRRRTIAARQAFGQIMQQNVGPDGTVNYENAAVMMAANPVTAWAAPEFIQQMATTKGLSIENTMRKLELSFRQQDAIAQTLAPYVAKGANVTHDEIVGAATQMQQSGMLGPGEAGQRMLFSVIKDLPQDGPGIAQYILNFSQRSHQTRDALERAIGQMAEINTGPTQMFARVSPLTGLHPVGEVTTGLSPAESSALVTIKAPPGMKDAQGNPIPAGTLIQVNRAQLKGAPPLTRGTPGTVTTTGGMMGDIAGGGGAAQSGATDGQVPPAGTGMPPADTAPQIAPNAAGGSSGAMTENPALTPGSAAAVAQGGTLAGPAGGGVAGTQDTGAVVGPSSQTDELRNAYVAEKTMLQQSITTGLPQLLQMKEALAAMGPGGANTGGLAGWRTKAANVLYGLGFDKDFVEAVGNGSLPLSQVIEKISATNSFQTLHQLLGGQNRATNLFVSMLHDNLPNIETHPAAAKEIYALFARMYTLQQGELTGMQKWEALGKPPEAFVSEGWIPWVNSPKGQAWINHLMTTTPQILQPEASRVVGAP